MSTLREMDPEIWQAIEDEKVRQRENIILIASENVVSQAVLEVTGSVMTPFSTVASIRRCPSIRVIGSTTMRAISLYLP